MLRPIELHSAGDPGTRETYESGLNHVLAIEEVVPVDLVQPDLDTATNLRHNHEPDKLVFDVGCLPLVSVRFRVDPVDHGQRVHSTTAPLIHTLFKEEWIRVRRCRHVRPDPHWLFPGLDGTCLSRRRRWQLQLRKPCTLDRDIPVIVQCVLLHHIPFLDNVSTAQLTVTRKPTNRSRTPENQKSFTLP